MNNKGTYTDVEENGETYSAAEQESKTFDFVLFKSSSMHYTLVSIEAISIYNEHFRCSGRGSVANAN